ncbi:hypothetical protein MNB_SV-13-986 [hydrothermal vent metagenome]|uniref:Uncharacterized protein n=1 Tax=hydrothermal vent metagenome TaxID=652676 RepID=A0A1W1C4Q7_9ZZZZ
MYQKKIEDKEFIVLKFVSDKLGTIKRYLLKDRVDLKQLPEPNKAYELVEIVKPLS